METERQLIAARKAPLSAAERNRVVSILNGPETNEVLIEKFAIDITRAKILCLRQRTWLNDEVINFYMSMLQVRDKNLIAFTLLLIHGII